MCVCSLLLIHPRSWRFPRHGHWPGCSAASSSSTSLVTSIICVFFAFRFSSRYVSPIPPPPPFIRLPLPLPRLFSLSNHPTALSSSSISCFGCATRWPLAQTYARNVGSPLFKYVSLSYAFRDIVTDDLRSPQAVVNSYVSFVAMIIVSACCACFVLRDFTCTTTIYRPLSRTLCALPLLRIPS